jgi:hypothetical protein
MTREDIIAMAREAGLHAPEGRTYILSPTIHPDDDLSEYLERFVALVASAAQAKERDASVGALSALNDTYEIELHKAIAEEREACAKVCDDLWKDNYTAYACSEAIRARGQA